jgi:sec-independent protein translocase protein TatC
VRLFGFRVTPDSDIDDTRISILDHLEELRGRLLKSIAAIAVLFPFCWYVCADVIDWFLEVVCVDLPRVQTLAVMELFFTQMKVSFFMALILAYPVVAFQAWRFVAPGLYRHERFYMSRFVIASTALFISGGEMALFYVFPRVVQFGAGMAQGKIEVAPQLSSVISLAAWLMLGFGVMFQLPIVVYLLAITGLVSVETMRKARPIIVIVIFTLAAILTPTPDIVTQCALAIPSYLLFEASILFTDVAVRRKRRREEEEKRQEEEEQQQRAQQEREAAGPAPESQALLTEAQPPADSSATVPPATTPDPAAALALDVTAPVEPPTESPPDTAPQALPGQYPAEATPDSPAREEPAGQTSWERWYGNVEEPPESLPAAAPGTAPVPGTTDLARDDLDTLGSGPV